MNPAIVVLTAQGAALARRLAPTLGARVHGLRRRVADADETFDETMAALRALYRAGHPIVGICAAGILVRALAPLLDDKRHDAPVVAVAEDGSVAVPLIGGHRGANALARQIASVTGGVAAITTAGDVALGVALDAPPPGWRIADERAVKPIAAALLAGERVAIHTDAELAPLDAWLAALPRAPEAAHAICITARAIGESESGRTTLTPTLSRERERGPEDRSISSPSPACGRGWGEGRADTTTSLGYHPPVLTLGVGGERGVDGEELRALVADTLAETGWSPASIACVCSIDLKADEPAVHALAAALGVPARFFTAAELAAEEKRLATPSEVVRRATGAPGVAEGAALAAAGAAGTLVVPKRKSARATCALALSPTAIDPQRVGRARGRLAVLGIGPGTAAWRTPEVSAALADADEVVGYALYLDLIADAIAGKPRHVGALGEEEARVRLALDRAAEGRSIALVSSGDAGIYGLATLVFELIERGGRDDWRRLDIRICPGVSALQAAAARAGAPLGHDFCAISLSDLLTPWETIERRLAAAAESDFVVALYNPASARRIEQLRRALALLAAHRPPETPVVVARNLGRTDEQVAIVSLAEAAAIAVDMLTIVIVGSSATRRLQLGAGARAYTPRGYQERVAP